MRVDTKAAASQSRENIPAKMFSFDTGHSNEGN